MCGKDEQQMDVFSYVNRVHSVRIPCGVRVRQITYLWPSLCALDARRECHLGIRSLMNQAHLSTVDANHTRTSSGRT